MTNTVLVKRSSVANSVPIAGDLSYGELALNYNDGNLFYKNSGNVVTVIASNQFVSVSGNITGGNILTPGIISASGTVIGGNLQTLGNVLALGNILASGNMVSGNIFITGATSAVGNVSGGNLLTNGLISATGTVNAGNITGANIISNGLISASGNIQGDNVFALGNMAAGNINITGTASATGNITGGNLLTNGLISTAGNIFITGTASATGNITGANIISPGLISAGGNITADHALFNGGLYANGNTSVNGILTVNGPAANENILRIKGGATGDQLIAYSGAAGNGVSSSSQNSAFTGFAPYGILASKFYINILDGNNTGVLANALVIDTTGNVSTAGEFSATGNITAGPSSYFIGNGSQLTGLSVSSDRIFNGTSNVLVTPANGPVTISADSVANTAVFSSGTLTLASAWATPKVTTQNATVSENVNAMLIGPVTLGPSSTITVPDSSTLYVYAP